MKISVYNLKDKRIMIFNKLYLSIVVASMTFVILSCTEENEKTVPVTGVSVEKEMLTLVVGDNLQLNAFILPEDATDNNIEWETSNPDVVSVDQDGYIIAVGEGSAIVYAVNGAVFASCRILVNPVPEKGFYYYSDGTYSKTFNTGKECIGVVFYVGHHPSDESDYSNTGIGMQKCHGYVVAREDADGQCQWGPETEPLDLFPKDADGQPIDNFTGNSGDLEWSGFKYTVAIRDFAEDKGLFTSERLEGYAACYYAVNYHLAAPEHSSGWFLPAVSQLYAIYANRDILNDHVDACLTGENWYWSSTEYYKIPDKVALFYNGETKNVEGRSKSSGLFIRPVIAF